MKFIKGAKVVTQDGRQVGEIDRVVIDPKSKLATDLVVRKGWLFPEDKVIPIDQVWSTADNDNVVLNANIDLDALPNYEELHYVIVDEEERAQMDYPATYAPALYPYPPYTFGLLPSTGGAQPGAPTYRVEEELGIPEDTVPLKPGTQVVSSEGTHVGDVEQVLTESTTQEVTHFVVSRGLLFPERKLIPVAWVDEISEDEVCLRVGTRQLEHLPDYNPRP